LTPNPAKIAAADPVQVSVTGDKAEIFVVLWIGAGEPPVGQASGTGPDCVLEIAGHKVRFDAASGRVKAE
jgi:hypothetical protein